MDEEEQSGFSMDKDRDSKSAGDRVREGKEQIDKARKTKESIEKVKKAKEVAEKTQKVAKVTKAASVASTVLSVLGIVILVIFILLIIAGILVFILTGFGLIKQGLATTVNGALDWAIKTWKGEENVVDDQQIIDLGQYLQEIGYDLYGYGFVTEKDAIIEEDGVYKLGAKYSKYGSDDNQNAYRNLRTYLISDNYGTLIRGNNKNIKSIFTHFFDTEHGWGNGMIKVSHQADGSGVTGKVGDEFNNLLEHGSVTILKDEKNGKTQLQIDGGMWNGLSFTYDLDGWIGRYGMPLEFLLATHIATMAPDLSYRLATSFETTVNLLLYKIEDVTVDAAVEINGKNISRSSFEKANDKFWIFDKFSSEEAYKVLHDSSIGLESYTGNNGDYECKESPVCSKKEEENGKACKNCTRYVNLISKALKETSVPSGKDTYSPYLASVTDHWYRNVYFTKAAIEPGDSIVATDMEYEKKTGERWTLYETDDDGNYEIYVYTQNSDGTYNSGYAQADGGDIVCKKVEAGKGDYKLASNGVTYERDSTGSYVLKVKKDGKYSDYNNSSITSFRVGKKAIIDEEATQRLANAYEAGQAADQWENLQETSNTDGDIVEAMNLGLNIKYKKVGAEVKQLEDGVRGQTNEKIKEIFLDEYYLYDGSEQTANLIKTAKEKNKYSIFSEKNNPRTFREQFGDDAIIQYTDDKGTTYTSTIDQISGPISLSKSALSAFSILTNMHTLDAEYIYHDFKELIVELNYFDKEDLAEPEDEVMMFPVAGLSAEGWPVVRYDKGEDFYGTLIYSREDLKARRSETELEIAQQFGYDLDEVNDPNIDTPEQAASAVASGAATASGEPVTVNGVTYKQFFQSDYNAPILPRTDGDRRISMCGCGICSTASILTGYGYDVTPLTLVDKLNQLGMNWNSSGRTQKIEQLFESYNIKGKWASASSPAQMKEIVQKAFDEGKPVIVRISSSGGPWTTNSGHYFAVGGVQNGVLYTMDSANRSSIERRVNSGGLDALTNAVGSHLNTDGGRKYLGTR